MWRSSFYIMEASSELSFKGFWENSGSTKGSTFYLFITKMIIRFFQEVEYLRLMYK